MNRYENNMKNKFVKKFGVDFTNHNYFKEAGKVRDKKIDWANVIYYYEENRSKFPIPVLSYYVDNNKYLFKKIKNKLIEIGLENNLKIGKFENLSFDKVVEIVEKYITTKYHKNDKWTNFTINEFGEIISIGYINQSKIRKTDSKFTKLGTNDDKYFIDIKLPNIPNYKAIKSNPILKDREESMTAFTYRNYCGDFVKNYKDKFNKHGGFDNYNKYISECNKKEIDSNVLEFIDMLNNNKFGDFDLKLNKEIEYILSKNIDSLNSSDNEALIEFYKQRLETYKIYVKLLEYNNGNYNFEPYIYEFIKMDAYDIHENHNSLIEIIEKKIESGVYYKTSTKDNDILEETEDDIYDKYNMILDKIKKYGKTNISTEENDFLRKNSEVWLNYNKE